ncbi:hypothetical protein IKG24_00210 [Candidatus Saccharibacteria bacterium]|nr:hypothetical protein [Candidatus Saccharibacteria bacterium]
MKERIMWAVTAVLAIGIVAVLVMWHIDVKEKEVIDSSDEDFELPEMAASAMEEGYIVEDDSTDDSFSFEAGATAVEEGSATEVDSVDVPEDAALIDVSDPYEMYKVSDEWAQNGGAYVQRDGAYYTISARVPEDVIERCGVGCIGYPALGHDASLYVMDEVTSDSVEVPTKNEECLISCGDFPILKIHRNETLYGYNATGLNFYRASFVGYTIQASRRPRNSGLSYFPIIDHRFLQTSDPLATETKEHIGLYDLNDNPVEDVHDLNYGEEYLFEYYVRTEYREFREVADCRCYALKKSELAYRIDGELTKNGYVTFDISEVEPGLYTAGSSVFEIVD